VKIVCTILIFLLTVDLSFGQQKAAPAQDDGSDLPPSLNQWLEDNIDPDALRVLRQMDAQRVQKLFSELQQAMHGTNIYQLGTLRETSTQVLPILQKYEETAPYAFWLQSRLDEMEASQEFQRRMKASAREPSLLPPSPPLKLQRQVWVRSLEKRPWPPLAKNYVPRLKEIFISERVPPELVWVAEVESSFNPSARSPAGAAGMFQLTPQTARDEQLSLWPWDERYQPEKSARAAARYLRTLHEHYDDWELALAAYNVGEKHVDKLLKQQPAHTFEAIARRLPAETQMYVPKIEATVRKREGKDLVGLKLPKT
jgi:membrane-bound lytic murein transglycosylase D